MHCSIKNVWYVCTRKNGEGCFFGVHPQDILGLWNSVKKIFPKNFSKSIVGIKKGFYICTRFGRKV
ncbi:hypothetical protein, partial [Hyunsoonleella flava]|uniref:hypothetical protein n=1 Tax=Hyunsoonleella flava TaxID=2527939 RepID=UPI001A934A5E